MSSEITRNIEPKYVSLSGKINEIGGRINPVGSKSITNRVLLLAALSNGTSHLKGALKSDDTKYMAAALRQMGVEIQEPKPDEFIVISNGKLLPSSKPLFLGNAGTAVRFLSAACAIIDGQSLITGDEHMQKRPIAPLVRALQSAGVEINCPTDCPPVEIFGKGKLDVSEIIVDGGLSSQYVSALLMIANQNQAPFQIKVKDGKIGALGYIDITLKCMKDFGARIKTLGPLHWEIAPSPYIAREYFIEPDASAATYIWGINALLGTKIDIGMDANLMSQPDARAFNIIQQFPNLPSIIDGSQMQDAIPTIAILAAFNNNPVRFIGIENLRVKECDRINAVATELNRIETGIAEEINDDLFIKPRRDLIGEKREISIHTYSDHRIAMAFSLAALLIDGIKILDPDCTAKTWPNYWRALESVGIRTQFN